MFLVFRPLSRQKRAGFFALCLGYLGGLWALNTPLAHAEPSPIRLNAAQVKSLGIEVQQGAQGAAARQGGFPGTVLLPHEQMRLLSAPLTVLVEQIYGAPGLPVKKGQWLFRLSVPQALELRRDEEQAVAANRLAQQSLKRDELLFAEGIIAESRLQATRAAAVQASAMLTERQAALKAAGLVQVGSGLFELRAPMDGVILEQQVQVGQRIEAAQLLGKIGRLNRFWVDFTAPAVLASSMRLGQPIELPSRQVSGKVIAIGRAVDASQNVLLRAQVDQGAERLAPGQSVEVALTGEATGQGTQQDGQGSLRLPSAALVRYQGGHYVFVQMGGDASAPQFAPVAVEVLGQNGEEVLIRALDRSPGKAGLRQAAVVTRGTSGLKAIWSGVGRE